MSKSPMAIHISTDVREINFAAFDDVYRSVGFHRGPLASFPNNYLGKLFGPGIFGFFAFRNENLVGVARILSDDIVCAHIAELCVHKKWQRNGVGRTLIEAVIKHISDIAIYADALNGQEIFFSKLGVIPQSKVVACGRAPANADWV